MKVYESSNNKDIFFVSVEEKDIEGTKFLKINCLDREENQTFSIYEKYTEDTYNSLLSIPVFSDISHLIFVVYKNGRLKFSIVL